jgi:hypothetical protein
MRTKNTTTNLPAAQTTVKDLINVLGTVVSTSSLLTVFPTLAFHMLITFYLLLIIMAMVVGKDGKSPSLMTFVLLWHFFALPTWILRSFTVKTCKKPCGMLIFFIVVVILFFVLQPHFITAMANIKSWIKVALLEIAHI